MNDFTSNPVTGASLSQRLSLWWKAKPARYRQKIASRVTLAGLCSAVLVFGMPLLSTINAQRQEAASFRVMNEHLAEVRQDELDLVDAVEQAPALLQHTWLRAVEHSLERDPAAALSRYTAYERDQAALKSLITLEVPKRTDAEDLVRQKQCLATAIYYEARSEQTAGQIAVAEVIVNRVKDHRYPNSICDVVFQGATRTTGCQFTFTCDGAMSKKPRGKRWDKAQSIAAHVLMGLNEAKTGGATHYHATYVDPVWNSGLIQTNKIGTHIFYRFPRGSEWSVASARQSQRMAQRASGLDAISVASEETEREPRVLGVAPEARTVAAAPRDLNAEALRTMQAADARRAQAEETEDAVITKRTVRRIVDGEVVGEYEIFPVTTPAEEGFEAETEF